MFKNNGSPRADSFLAATMMSERRKPVNSQYIPWWKVIVWTFLFQIAWSWRYLEPVLVNGELVGPDDFLRFHQIEKWMNGQNWYEMTAYRMFPPEGADIHWSRLVDVPVATISWFLELFCAKTQDVCQFLHGIGFPSCWNWCHRFFI